MNSKGLKLQPAAIAIAVISSLAAGTVVAQQLSPNLNKHVIPAQGYKTPMVKGERHKQVQPDKVTRYIVELHDPAVATYKGGIAGFEPTAPEAANTKKLSLASAPVQSYQQRLLQKQNEVFARLKTQVPELKIRDHLSLVMNGMVVEATGSAGSQEQLVKRLQQTPGVKRVYADEPYYSTMVASNALINSPEVWTALGGNAVAGRDIKVAVIDSGIDPDHPMFQDNGHAPVTRPTNPDYCSTEPTFCNDKLIVARWYEPFGDVSEQEVRTPQDVDGHGTHVAGTAVGNPVSTTFNGVAINMSGVAPGAHLMVYKALFNDTEGNGTGSSVSLTQALEDAVADGADIINNSWGGSAGDPPQDSPYVAAFAAARSAGVLTVTAAGNDGPGDRTIGCPGCIEDGLTIASSQTGAYFMSRVTAANLTTDSTPGSGDFSIASDITARLDLSANFDTNTLACSSFPNGVFAGEIVLVPRGTCTFVEKANNVQAAGAVGMIVYTDDRVVTTMAMDGATLPSVMISQSAGQQIESRWTSISNATIFAPSVARDPVQEDSMSEFSSRGPNGDSSFLKPDLTAPGSSILSAVPGSAYGQLSGTSMASPHVAGAAALLLDKRDDWAATELKSLLMTSSTAGLRDDDEITAATPFDRGAGRLDVAAAANSFVVVDKASLASNSCAIGCSFTRRFTNRGDSAVSFDVSIEFSDPSVTAALSDSVVTLAPGENATLTIDVDTRYGVSGWQFGELLLSSGGSTHPDMRLPIALLAETSDDASIVSVGETTVAPFAGDPFGIEVLGALGDSEEPVTLRIDVPAEVTLDRDSVVFTESLSQTTSETVSSDGRTITWQGTQTNSANTTEMNPATGQFFAGKRLSELLTDAPNRLCDTTSCDDDEFRVDIADEGGIYLDGTRYDSLVATTNGVVGAGSNTSDYSDSALNQSIPNEAPPNGLWAPFWTDLEVGPDKGDGRINYVWLEEGGNQWFVWEVENAREYGDDTNVPYTFSIWFKLGTDEVYYNYIDLPTVAPEQLTIGVESGVGNRGVIGIQHYYDGAGSYPSSGDVLTPVVAAGDKAKVLVDFNLAADLGDIPMLEAETESGSPVTIPVGDAFAELGRAWLTYAEVSSGTDSYDAFLAQKVEPEGAIRTEVVSQPANGTVEVNSNDLRYTSNNGFTGQDSFTYRGVDASGQVTGIAEVMVTVIAGAGNSVPTVTATASASQVAAGDTVTLTASGSDADGDALSYEWVQVTDTSGVELTNANQAVASFTAPAVNSTETLTFEVVVSDGEASAAAMVNVTISSTNVAPEAFARAVPSDVESGGAVQLRANESTDANGDTLTYTWRQTSGINVTLSANEGEEVSFTAPIVSTVSTLGFELTASDGELQDTATVNVVVSPSLGRVPEPDTESSGSFPWWLALMGTGLAALRRRSPQRS